MRKTIFLVGFKFWLKGRFAFKFSDRDSEGFYLRIQIHPKAGRIILSWKESWTEMCFFHKSLVENILFFRFVFFLPTGDTFPWNIVCAYTHTHTHTDTHKYTHSYTYTLLHIYYTNTNTYTNTHTHTYVHRYTQDANKSCRKAFQDKYFNFFLKKINIKTFSTMNSSTCGKPFKEFYLFLGICNYYTF